MKKFKTLRRTLQLLLLFILILGINSNVSATEKYNLNEPNRIDAEITTSFAYSQDNKLEKIQATSIDMDQLKVGNNEIYRDGETVINLLITIPVTNTLIQPYVSGSSPWSGGSIPTTAILNPNKSIAGIKITYQLDWLNNRIDSAHSLDYTLPLAQISREDLTINRAAATSSLPAMANGEITYSLIQYGIVVGSYKSWLRTEINRYNQLRLVWNF